MSYSPDSVSGGTKVIRSRPEANYTQILNAVLRDQRLTHMARGVLCEMLSNSDGWVTSSDRMWKLAAMHRPDGRRGEGRRAYRAVFADLEAAGYLERKRLRHGDGRFYETVLILHDTPREPSRDPSENESTVPLAAHPVPPAETPSSPRSDHSTGNGRLASGTSLKTPSVRTLKDGLQDRSPDGPRSQAKAARDSDEQILEDVRAAIAAVYGDRENIITEDENALWLWEALRPQDGRAVRRRRAYLEKIFSDTPDLDSIYARYGSGPEYDEPKILDPLKPCPRCVADGRETMIAPDGDLCSRCEWDLLAGRTA